MHEVWRQQGFHNFGFILLIKEMDQDLDIDRHEQISVLLLQHLPQEPQAFWLIEHPVNPDAPDYAAMCDARRIFWVLTKLLLEEVFIDI